MQQGTHAGTSRRNACKQGDAGPCTENRKHTGILELRNSRGAGDDHVTGLRIRNTETGAESDIALSAFFVAIGHEPNSSLFRGILDMDEQGYLITQPGTTKTNIEGVFACGDVQDKIYRQAVSAAGTGCMAALDAERYLGAMDLH